MNQSASAAMPPAPNNSTVTRLQAVVRGRVQGVGYRFWAHHAAQKIGIEHGQVRNLPDGTVEVEAEHSDRYTLESLLHDLHHGPTSAHVDDVAVIWEENVVPRYAQSGGLLVV